VTGSALLTGGETRARLEFSVEGGRMFSVLLGSGGGAGALLAFNGSLANLGLLGGGALLKSNIKCDQVKIKCDATHMPLNKKRWKNWN
jgi:hypothetical protein